MPSLSELDRSALLRLARKSIEEAVCRDHWPEVIPHDGVFAERSGVFVTLHVRGQLRGCIGVIEAEESLGESVARCAVSAALQDPRFSPLSTDELADLDVEISLLTPPQPIRPEEVVIGRHGLLISQGSRRGLLLPQVATEHQLSRERFLEETCRKAGLPTDAWKNPSTKLYAFTCEVLAEESRKSPQA